LELNLNIILL